MANISNSASNTVITGTADADSIYNSASTVTIEAAAGNDTITTTGQAVLSSGDGIDVISIGSGVTNITLTDLDTSNDSLIFAKEIPVASLRHSAREGEVHLSSSDMTIVFKGISSLSPDILNYSVRNGDTVNTISDLIGRRVVNSAISTDIVFLIDHSGSMSTAIRNVKTNVENFVESLEAANFDVQLGLVDYESSATVTTDLTADVETFKNSLSTNTWGGIERGLTAIQLASSDITFRDGAFREYIVVTDEGYEENLDGGEQYGYVVENTYGSYDNVTVSAADLNSALNGVHLDVFGENYYDCRYDYEPIATTTGGQFYNMSDGFATLISMLSENIVSAATHVKIDLSNIADDQTGVFSPNSSVDYIGDTIISEDVTFYTSAENAGTIVGSVEPSKVYNADNDSVRQSLTVPGGWNVTATDKNDDIVITGSGATINARGGDDRITLNGGSALIEYNSGDGNDIVYGFKMTDRLQISGTNTGTMTSGNDVIVTVDNGSITLKDAADTADNNHVQLHFWNYTYNQSESDAPEVHLDNSIVLINEDGGSEIITPAESLAMIWANDLYTSAKIIDASRFGGQSILVGNALENSIKASSGGSSIWGGAGSENDTLIGGSGADAFFFAAGNGNDVIENADSNDHINLPLSSIEDISGVTRDGDSITANFKEGGSLKVNTSNIDFKFSDGSSRRVANSDDDGNFKFWVQENVASDAADFNTLSANSIVLGDDAAANTILTPFDSDTLISIWANGADGNPYPSARNIDASRFGGQSILVGNALENVITSSNGNSTLWGGNGSENDTLIGGSGEDVFFYAEGNGNDVIENAEVNDIISINLPIDAFDSSYLDGISENSLTMKFNDGGSIQVNSNADVGFTFQDGSTWHAVNRNSTDKHWEARS